MTDSRILKILGVVYLSIGMGAFLDPAYFNALVLDFIRVPSSLYLGGVAALVIGYILVTPGWKKERTWSRVVVSLIGCLALVKGLVILVLPQYAVSLTSFFVGYSERGLGLAAGLVALGVLFSLLGILAGRRGS